MRTIAADRRRWRSPLVLYVAALAFAVVPGSRGGKPAVAAADSETDAGAPPSAGHTAHDREVFLHAYPETRTLTRDWLGVGGDLREHGVTATLDFWITYQGNVTGGLSRNHAASGLYWFANHFDLERLLGLTGAAAYVLVEGGWGEGINASLGTMMDANGTAVGDEPIGVTRLGYDQGLLGGRLRLRLGKIGVTTENFEVHGRSVAFDAMAYANTPRSQFLASGLVNNSSVPFPAAGLAGMLLVEAIDGVYIAGAGIDRQPDSFAWGYSDAFDDWMALGEAGLVAPVGSRSLIGQYYLGHWYSSFPAASDGEGVYFGAAQELYREPAGSRGARRLLAIRIRRSSRRPSPPLLERRSAVRRPHPRARSRGNRPGMGAILTARLAVRGGSRGLLSRPPDTVASRQSSRTIHRRPRRRGCARPRHPRAAHLLTRWTRV